MLSRSMVVALLLSAAAVTCADETSKGLFESNGPIAFVIDAPLRRLVRDRTGESPYRDAVLRYEPSESGTVVVPVQVQTRGRTRRRKDVCDFPPLRLRFEDEAVDGTLFEGQTTLKLVTHCRGADSRDNLVVQEYLAYRVYNLLTDYSMRVRLAEITYEEAGNRRGRPRYGILLEHWKSVARRTGATPVDADGAVNIRRLSPQDANRVALFNYLIGNEDWSLLWPEHDENCCHNVKPLLANGVVIPLPYDFDYAGIVNAPYAMPKPPNKSVRRRRYHGLCETQGDLEASLQLFRERRDAIYGLYRSQPELIERKRKSSLAYLDGFYEVINDPVRVERRLLQRCAED